jgi:hypothetical protein
MNYEKELINPDIYPDENILQNIFDKGYEPFKELLSLFDKHEISYEWKYYNDVKMWLCKAVKKKKTIVWMSAVKGFLRATVYIPERHIDGIYELGISDTVKEMIKNTKNTGKSKGCTFEIRNKKILKDFEIIMQYKMSLK